MVPFSPHPRQYLFVFVVFLITVIVTDVRGYLTVVLIGISLMIVMLSIFSCACWPSVWLFWKNVYSGPLPIFLTEFLFDIQLYEFFIYFGYEPLITHIICKYLLPLSRLPFHLIDGFLCCAKASGSRTWAPFEFLPLPWDPEHVRFCMCPLRAQSLYPLALQLSNVSSAF